LEDKKRKEKRRKLNESISSADERKECEREREIERRIFEEKENKKRHDGEKQREEKENQEIEDKEYQEKKAKEHLDKEFPREKEKSNEKDEHAKSPSKLSILNESERSPTRTQSPSHRHSTSPKTSKTRIKHEKKDNRSLASPQSIGVKENLSKLEANLRIRRSISSAEDGEVADQNPRRIWVGSLSFNTDESIISSFSFSHL